MLGLAGGFLCDGHIDSENIGEKRFYNFVLFGYASGLRESLLGKRDVSVRTVMDQAFFSQQFQCARNRWSGHTEGRGNILAPGRTGSIGHVENSFEIILQRSAQSRIFSDGLNVFTPVFNFTNKMLVTPNIITSSAFAVKYFLNNFLQAIFRPAAMTAGQNSLDLASAI